MDKRNLRQVSSTLEKKLLVFQVKNISRLFFFFIWSNLRTRYNYAGPQQAADRPVTSQNRNEFQTYHIALAKFHKVPESGYEPGMRLGQNRIFSAV